MRADADRYLELLISRHGGRRPRYRRHPSGLAELIPDLLYRGRLLDTVAGGSVTVTLFLRIGELGGALWEQEMRILERLAGLGHPSLPVLDDGGYLKSEDGSAGAAFIRTKTAGAPAESEQLLQLFRERRGEALRQLWLLADALAVIHDCHIAHRLLSPGNIDVERQDGVLAGLRLSRFEMGGLLSNLFDTGHTLGLAQVRGLYLGQPTESLPYNPPERLRFLFDKPDGQLGGPKGDVFSLGMMTSEWLLGPALPDEPPPTAYDDCLRRHEATRAMLSRRRTELPASVAEILSRMIDPDEGSRPTAYQVSQRIAAGYGDARAVLDDDLPHDPYVVAYMPKECDKTLLRWGLIQSSAETDEGRDDLIDLIERDMRGVEILHSPDGAVGFVSGLDDKKLRQAKTVIVGREITWFADRLWLSTDEGFPAEYDQIMVIRFVRQTVEIATKLDALRVNAMIGRLPIVEAIAMPKDREVAEAFSLERPSWSALVQKTESGRSLSAEEQDYLEALDWYLRYQRALLAARTYAYVLEAGSKPGRAVLRWDTATDRSRSMADPIQRKLVHDSRRLALAEFVAAASDDGDMVPRLELSASLGGFGAPVGPLDVVDRHGPDAIEVDRGRLREIPPSGWLRLRADAGTLPQINRQARARVELASQRLLIQQLMRPQARSALDARWDGAGGALKGEGRDAVVAILKHGGLFALQGPPGTGKTEVASQAVADYVTANPRARVLVSAQSHHALDNLAGRILDKLGMTRSGGQDFRLDRLALRAGASRTLDQRRDTMDERVAAFLPPAVIEGVLAYSTSRARQWLASRRTERLEMVPVIDEWLSKLRRTRIEINRRLPSAANVVFATTGSATPEALSVDVTDEPFHWVIVEEAARAWPTELAMPLLRGVRWTLIGDHAQIGAFAKGDIERFLMELKDDPEPALAAMYEMRHTYAKRFETFAEIFRDPRSDAPRKTLTQEYRMDKQISDLIGDVFYADSGGLDARRPTSVPPLSAPEYFVGPRLVWVDTGDATRSVGFWANENEAELCARVVRAMRPADGRDRVDLAVLTPYRQQVQVVEQLLSEHASRIFTVDGFQGREADVVVVSLVRDRVGRADTAIANVGHVASAARANVLLSRARDLLVVVGCLDIYQSHAGSKWRQVAEHFREHGTVIAAQRVSGR